MKRFALIAVGLCCVTAAGQEKPTLTREQVLKAISFFSVEPLTERGQAMASAIISFTDASEEIEIVLDQKLYPWLGREHGVKDKQRRALLTALVAGNARAQLETGVARDDPYSGLLYLFSVYNQLKQDDKDFSIPTIEEQLAAYRAGTLHEYIVKHKSNNSELEPLSTP